MIYLFKLPAFPILILDSCASFKKINVTESGGYGGLRSSCAAFVNIWGKKLSFETVSLEALSSNEFSTKRMFQRKSSENFVGIKI